ncbi:MAG: NAD(P)-binding protein [Deltaproteobacteria bacterium]|nr:NAD(P)-binding protein [Deltaproteobacteria bacterium]
MTTPAERALAGLPAYLEGRVRAHSGGAPTPGAFVLCWLRQSLRAVDNPALDVALYLADALGVPVFVYHALTHRRPWATARSHWFLLEAHRDLSAGLAARGIGAAFHLELPGQERPVLRELAAEACAVIADEVPVPPLDRWLAGLAAGPAPVLGVDCHNLVPMRWAGPVHERATAFRDRHSLERARRRALPRADALVRRPGFRPATLPFAPLDWATVGEDPEGIGALVAAAGVDPTLGRVHDTPGGRTAALARWRAFLAQGGVEAYARLRNDADQPGVSRMSAHLHVGAVSSFELIDAVDAIGGPGADKFADELLVWRELAWHWCARQPALHSVDALPLWARRTLLVHARDPRTCPDGEQIERGRTGDPLFDLAQQGLLRHGELHNNVRMTWGKAIVGWTPDPQAAIDRLVSINHRCALDGRDPASYGGLYWCLGLFDRPFTPERPVTGALRPRPTADHAARLDLASYGAVVRRPRRAPAPRVAIVGAGPAGLACARVLRDHGLEVSIFDKGRGPGGRLSTRRIEGERFDHGAQFLTTRDPAIGRWFAAWRARGLLQPWEPRQAGPGATLPSTPWLVPVPGMSALIQHLCVEEEPQFSTLVDRVERVGSGWKLYGRVGSAAESALLTEAEVVVIATPAPQAAPLLAAAPQLRAAAAERLMEPNLTVLLRLLDPVEAPVDLWRGAEGPLAWAARCASRPGRPAGPGWVLLSSADWAAAHLEDPPELVASALVEAFAEALGALGGALPPVLEATAHRWRYARPHEGLAPQGCLWGGALGIGACGDWLEGPRVEAALRSGAALAGRVLDGR